MDLQSSKKPLQVDAVYFTGDAQPVQNCIIWLAGAFLVIAKYEGDPAPIWYNIAQIDRMEGVRPYNGPKSTSPGQQAIFF